eukprot:Nk52_evm12s222 gene=Nk52_evmTU12s222
MGTSTRFAKLFHPRKYEVLYLSVGMILFSFCIPQLHHFAEYFLMVQYYNKGTGKYGKGRLDICLVLFLFALVAIVVNLFLDGTYTPETRSLKLSYKKARSFWYSSVYLRAFLCLSVLPIVYEVSNYLLLDKGRSPSGSLSTVQESGFLLSKRDFANFGVGNREMSLQTKVYVLVVVSFWLYMLLSDYFVIHTSQPARVNVSDAQVNSSDVVWLAPLPSFCVPFCRQLHSQFWEGLYSTSANFAIVTAGYMLGYGNALYTILPIYYAIMAAFHCLRVMHIKQGLLESQVYSAYTAWVFIYLCLMHYVMFVSVGLLWESHGLLNDTARSFEIRDHPFKIRATYLSAITSCVFVGIHSSLYAATDKSLHSL